MVDTASSRAKMVNNQLRTFDVTDHRVQDAMAAVVRERFVPADQRAIAYSDEAITIARDAIGRATRTMTRPAVLGRLLQLAQIRDGEAVLLIGAGVGYTAAVLSLLAGRVVALESDPDLSSQATAALDGLASVTVVTGPLADGWAVDGPYDVAFVDGAILTPPSFIEQQLKPGGRLVGIEGEGLAGRAMMVVKGATGRGGTSTRYVFNAAATVLPGFVPKPSFTF